LAGAALTITKVFEKGDRAIRKKRLPG